MVVTRKKLIEVALPLDAINKASAREKSIRHGHPSTLHLWWARRPLATARAVIFAQMVDDPSEHPDLFPTEQAQEKERQRLFRIIEDLVKWENTTNETVLQAARDEIWQSWRRTCAENADHPQAKELFDRNKLPAFHDPFAGGGSLPLEAQRLGLESYASDLNPVAVLINKAMIEIPPKFVGRPPVNPDTNTNNILIDSEWAGFNGLTEDIRYYGQWAKCEAESRIGHLYPKIEVTADMAEGRTDLNQYIGRNLTVIAWLWARTVKSPNPAFAHVDVPLVSSFMLSIKSERKVYVDPIVHGSEYKFTVKTGNPENEAKVNAGTKIIGKGQGFNCLLSGTPMDAQYIRAQAVAGNMNERLMAVVVEGDKGRIYLAPTSEMENIAASAKPGWVPDFEITHWPGRTNVVQYGMTKWESLFTKRQLVALDTFSELICLAGERAAHDAAEVWSKSNKQESIEDISEFNAYGDAIATFLALAVGRSSDAWSSISTWANNGEFVRGTFRVPGLRMAWDFAEVNPFSHSSGNWSGACEWVSKSISSLLGKPNGYARQADAKDLPGRTSQYIVSTDPPYFDNICYAELSDFFYVWLRKSIDKLYPSLFSTVLVPKNDELVANPYRHGGKEAAEIFFMDGITESFRGMMAASALTFPITIYYAFKQTEDTTDGIISTGWERFLESLINLQLLVTATWPVRTERTNRSISIGQNALASSIVLVCRPRPDDAPITTRREFITALKTEFPTALGHLQSGNIAPVDLAQAAIGPGMQIYTRYAQVLNAEGRPLTVREALALINQTLDEVLAEQEGDFDADSRWALTWFEELGFAEGEYGMAEQLSKSKVTSVEGMVAAGILESNSGNVRLFRPDELPKQWDPMNESRTPAWGSVHHLVRAIEEGGDHSAAELMSKLGVRRSEEAREMAYRLYSICERKGWAKEAFSYNSLVQSWPEISRISQQEEPSEQGSLL